MNIKSSLRNVLGRVINIANDPEILGRIKNKNTTYRIRNYKKSDFQVMNFSSEKLARILPFAQTLNKKRNALKGKMASIICG